MDENRNAKVNKKRQTDYLTRIFNSNDTMLAHLIERMEHLKRPPWMQKMKGKSQKGEKWAKFTQALQEGILTLDST